MKDHDQREEAAEAAGAAVTTLAVYGLVLPHNRLQERDADRIGVMLAAQAGYDPRESVSVWERVGRQTGRWSTSFLSTHPGASQRVADLIVWSGKALLQYGPTPTSADQALPGLIPPARPNPFGL